MLAVRNMHMQLYSRTPCCRLKLSARLLYESMPSFLCCNTGAWEAGSIFIGWYGHNNTGKKESEKACSAQNGTLLEDASLGGARLREAVLEFRRTNAKSLGTNTLLYYGQINPQTNTPRSYLALCTRSVTCKSC